VSNDGVRPIRIIQEADMAILRYTFSVVLEKLTESQKYKSQQSVSGENMNWLCCIYDLEA